MSLSCSHIIRWWLTESGCLKLKDFDSHWWFDAPLQSCLLFIYINDIDIDSLLQIADPSMARPRGCPKGALNWNPAGSLNCMWQQHEHDISMQHDPSAFKWVYVTERSQSNGPLPQQHQIGIVHRQSDQTNVEPNPVHNAGSMTESSIHVNEFTELPEVIVVTEATMITADLTTNIASNLPIQINKLDKFSESDDLIDLPTLKELLVTEAPKAPEVNIATETTVLITASLTFNNATNSPIQNNEGLLNSAAPCYWGTWVRRPTKCAAEAEAPCCCIRIRRAWDCGKMERFIC